MALTTCISTSALASGPTAFTCSGSAHGMNYVLTESSLTALSKTLDPTATSISIAVPGSARYSGTGLIPSEAQYEDETLDASDDANAKISVVQAQASSSRLKNIRSVELPCSESKVKDVDQYQGTENFNIDGMTIQLNCVVTTTSACG